MGVGPIEARLTPQYVIDRDLDFMMLEMEYGQPNTTNDKGK